LGQPHSLRAVALNQSVMWVLDRDAYLRMSENDSSLCILVQHCLLKSLSASATLS